MGWKGMTRSVCGTRHHHQGVPCQDYGAYWFKDDLIIGAIADGAGSASHSDIGAKLAVNTLLESIQTSDHGFLSHPQSWVTLPDSALTDTTQKCFIKAIATVQNTLTQHAKQSGYAVDELACTLLGFLATPRWIAALQIGDGFIVIRSQHTIKTTTSDKDKLSYHLLFEPDKGEYANQTTFVTSPGAIKTLQTRVVMTNPSFICAATDGLESVAIRRRDAHPFPPFFAPLDDYLMNTPIPEQEDDYVMAFLQSERLNQRTDDDKTLLLCRYKN